MFFGSRQRQVGSALSIAGVIAMAFGIIWIAAIFGTFLKVPGDLDRTVELAGEYTLTDQVFLGQLQGNATIAQLLSSGAGDVLATPASLEVLQSPALGSLIADPALLATLSNPQAVATLMSPEIGAVLSNSLLLSVLANPAVIAGLTDPAALLPLLADPQIGPVLQQLLADPAIAALLTNEAVITLLSSGVVGTLAANPELLALLANPAVGSLLANPGVQALLADPAALALVLDPRTLQVIANPANLPTVELPVLIHRERKATGTDGDQLMMNEQVMTTIAGTSQEVPGFAKTNVDLLIDRVTKEYLPGGDGDRSGHWGMPFDTDQDTVYQAYISVAAQPLSAKYEATEDVLGLETYRYAVREENVPYVAKDPATGLPMVVDVEVIVWLEPSTGAAVDAVDIETISALTPTGAKFVRFTADMSYTDETVASLVATAEDDKGRLTLYGTTFPWVFLVLGLLASAAGAVILVRNRRESAAQ
jgi:hypothetical protein